jgi:type III secretion protein S
MLDTFTRHLNAADDEFGLARNTAFFKLSGYMFQNQIVIMSYQGLLLILILSAPPVLISMLLGTVVAIFQAATQIQEQTISFVVKLVAVTLTLVFMGDWLGQQILLFSSNIFTNFAEWSLS